MSKRPYISSHCDFFLAQFGSLPSLWASLNSVFAVVIWEWLTSFLSYPVIFLFLYCAFRLVYVCKMWTVLVAVILLTAHLWDRVVDCWLPLVIGREGGNLSEAVHIAHEKEWRDNWRAGMSWLGGTTPISRSEPCHRRVFMEFLFFFELTWHALKCANESELDPYTSSRTCLIPHII